MIRVLAPAKVNLRLEVLAREESGFHQIETLFCALELADEIQLEERPATLELRVVGAELGPPEENLVHRAVGAFFAAAGLAPNVRITLTKHVPHGAGLGGGSSDAAATLLALDRMHGEVLGPKRRLELGAGLGSDVPFFLCGSPLALAWGRGERLLPLEPLPARELLLLIPPEGVSTRAAYEALAAARAAEGSTPRPRVLRMGRFADWDDVASHATNDFEPLVLGRIPELATAHRLLAEHGALMTLLSGSGSAYYGVFEDGGRLRAAEQAVRAALPSFRTIVTRTACPAALPPFG